MGWRISEPDTIKFQKEDLKKFGVTGPDVRQLEKEGRIKIDERWVRLDEVSHVRTGDVFAYVVDTRYCKQAVEIARNAKVLICESTYLERDRDLAEEYHALTARQAAELAKEANVQQLILTHFSARYRDLEELGQEARAIFPIHSSLKI